MLSTFKFSHKSLPQPSEGQNNPMIQLSGPNTEKSRDDFFEKQVQPNATHHVNLDVALSPTDHEHQLPMPKGQDDLYMSVGEHVRMKVDITQTYPAEAPRMAA